MDNGQNGVVLIVFVTAPSEEEASRLANQMVGAGLAACVQILPQMTSVYRWKGEVQSDREHLMLIKTLEDRYRDLESFIKSNHSYEVPEIIAVRAEHVSAEYHQWTTSLMDNGQR